MRLIGNILWLVLAGFWMSVGYVFAAVACVIGIITIPFAIPTLKLAVLALWPFGRAIVKVEGGAARGCLNIVWFALAGLWIAIGHALTGLLLCLTVIGIPFGIVSFRLARMALWPFGYEVVPAATAPPGAIHLTPQRPTSPRG